jgi:hypothetical protein
MTESTDQDREKDRSYRFDWVMEVVRTDDKTGEIEVFLTPDPGRYEWRERRGEKVLFDKFDNAYFAPEVWKSFVEQLKGFPITFEAPKMSDAHAYIGQRRSEIAAMLDGTPATGALQVRGLC